MPRKDPVARAEYQRLWLERNPLKTAQYYDNRKEEARAHARAYYAAHKAEHLAYATTPPARFSALNTKARTRGIEVSITYDEFLELDVRPCVYCNNEMEGGKSPFGWCLDRIDNAKGYELGNLQPCCGTCNYLRSNMLTVEETHAAVQAILAYRKERGHGQDTAA